MVLCDHDAPDAPSVLRAALASEAAYVAMMASRRRSEGLVAELVAEGVDITRLHVPAGHNLGGKAPGEIALSVVAEIVAESYDRPGGAMRGCGYSVTNGPSIRASVRHGVSRIGSPTSSAIIAIVVRARTGSSVRK